MSEKQEDNLKAKDDHDDIPKSQSIHMTKKDENKNENDKKVDEHSLEEIEKELDELRPKPPSPKTQHQIEEEEKKKDHQMKHRNEHKRSSVSIETKSNNENENQHHKDNDLTPGQPDPTVNENIKIPILNDHGDIELKPQQGSALNKYKNNCSSNVNQSTEQNQEKKE